MKKQRKHYSPEEKVAVLRRHLLEKEPISKLCDELGLQPTALCAGRRSSSSTVRLPLSRNLSAEPFSRAGADRLPGEENPDFLRPGC